MSGHLNIGHRHMLPVYPALFILGGAAVAGEERLSRAAGGRWRFCVLAAETVWRFPDYLSYFNGLVRPSEGYRHLVDSSLDWGQDLPAARRYIEIHPRDGPFFLSYFGSASPAAYGVRAETANCAMPADEPPGSLPVQALDFRAGCPGCRGGGFPAAAPRVRARRDGGRRRERPAPRHPPEKGPGPAAAGRHLSRQRHGSPADGVQPEGAVGAVEPPFRGALPAAADRAGSADGRRPGGPRRCSRPGVRPRDWWGS